DWEFGSDGLEDFFTASVDLNRFGAATAARERRQSQVITVTPARKSEPPAVEPLHPISPLTQAFSGANATAKIGAIRYALDKALEQWWGQGELPSAQVLRDGLLVLEAGVQLGESQRTLLLRTALTHGKGIITALRHQNDSERTATLLKEALLDQQTSFAPLDPRPLREQDEKSQAWVPLLSAELTAELPTIFGYQRQIALAGLAVLSGKNGPASLFTLPFDTASTLPATPLAWSRFRVVLLTVLICLLVTVYLWRHGQSPAVPFVTIPAGQYTVGDGVGEPTRTVELDAFAMDQTEVTNRNYQLCVQAGHCAKPASNASATRSDYFLEPAFANFPVVNVNWRDANAFCRWAGKRLPTAEEWEIAAGFAPATQHYYPFPWGAQFQPQLTNSLATPGNDTRAVGMYHPQGDSPFGLMDMAGNVAEWTTTSPDADADSNYLVKGGSFQDQPAALRTTASQPEANETATDWLGFRCADTLGN
ncbi:MAG: SUMF1/EgtB/PvdO family nonheme iron enzyme, partial [Chloroflexi bacterium]|nr:SUMF1/EgtB/PvdO family nonheme iron enzyme [Chloroflexota bacterium]